MGMNTNPTRQDLKGRKFGALTATRTVGKTKTGNMIWRCSCACGNRVDKPAQYLKRARATTISCGCIRRTTSLWQDITGRQYGRLTVLKMHSQNERGEYLWKCKCDCGKTKVLLGTSFKYGKVKSCGCLHKETISGANNYQAKRTFDKYGVYLPSSDPFYERAMSLMQHARREGVPVGFRSIVEFALHIRDITPEKCPVFGVKLKSAKGKPNNWSPSVDKIDPKKGYVRGNLQVMSWLANAMKRDATPKQLKQFARWALKGEKIAV